MSVPSCKTLPRPPVPIEISFPGGGTVASLHKAISEFPNPTDYILNAMAQAGPGLAPFKPFFDLMALAQALVNCQEAVPKAISSLSPDPVLDCIPDALEKLDAVLKLEPHLSVPISIITVVKAMIKFIESIIELLILLLTRIEELTRLRQMAERIKDAALDALMDCAESDLSALRENASAAMDATGPLMTISKQYLKEADLDVVMEWDEIPDGIPLDDLISFFQDVKRIFEEVERFIPV